MSGENSDASIGLLRAEDLRRYPGLYEKGSKGDINLEEMRRLTIQRHDYVDNGAIQLRHAGPLASEGVIKEFKTSDFMSASVPSDDCPPEAAFSAFDGPALVLFDAKLRFCYMVIVESGVVENVGKIRDLEGVRAVMVGSTPRTAIWYAAKCLMHAERVVTISDRLNSDGPISDLNLFALYRELISFGETWAEAKFVVNHGYDAVSGIKYRRKSRQGAEMRRGSYAPHTPAVLDEMTRLIEGGHTLANAARLTASKGIGKNAKANRKLWYDHK